MKGVDIYSSIPDKPITAMRQPAPPSRYDDDDYMSPASFPTSPLKNLADSQPSEKEARAYEHGSPRSLAKSVHPWKQDDAHERSDSESSPRSRTGSIESRDYRDHRL